MKILMVCLGNICRSPMAEGILQHKMNLHRVAGKVDSAGVIGYHAGESPDKRAIAVSEKHRIDISGQRARQIQMNDFRDFDLILAMDRAVYNEIASRAPSENARDKVQLFMDQSESATVKDVPDPYYGGPEGFEKVFEMIDQCCDELIRKLQKS